MGRAGRLCLSCLLPAALLMPARALADEPAGTEVPRVGAPPSATASAAPPPATAPPPPAPWQRFVQFDAATPDAELQRRERAGGRYEWLPVCRAPCRQWVTSGDYRVSGPGVTRSRPFGIFPGAEPLVIRADAGSSTARTIGIVMTPVGGVTVLLGFAMLIVTGINCADPHPEGRRAALQSDCDERVVPALVFAGGAGLLAGGIVMIAVNATRVTADPLRAASRGVELGAGLRLTPRGLSF